MPLFLHFCSKQSSYEHTEHLSSIRKLNYSDNIDYRSYSGHSYHDVQCEYCPTFTQARKWSVGPKDTIVVLELVKSGKKFVKIPSLSAALVLKQANVEEFMSHFSIKTQETKHCTHFTQVPVISSFQDNNVIKKPNWTDFLLHTDNPSATVFIPHKVITVLFIIMHPDSLKGPVPEP